MEKFTSEQILAHGMSDVTLGRKAALRGLIWFGFGYHLAHQKGDKEARDYLADMRALLKEGGAVKSEQSTKAKITKAVGSKFERLFGSELASVWADDADMVQACFNAAQASGATTVKRLFDWAEYGNPNHTDDAAAAKKAEKEAEKQAEAMARLAGVMDTEIKAMGFETEVAPVAAAPVAETESGSAPVQNLNLEDMGSAEFEALLEAVLAEETRRRSVEIEKIAVNG